jgi:hypothetical protein
MPTSFLRLANDEHHWNVMAVRGFRSFCMVTTTISTTPDFGEYSPLVEILTPALNAAMTTLC